MLVQLEDHPLLAARGLITMFPAPLGDLPVDPLVEGLLKGKPDAQTTRTETLRQAIRALLRHGGYKPTGRGKPASEYLIKAAEAGQLSPINAAVDVCNAVSLHSGFPISVVDYAHCHAPLSIGTAEPDSRYVFNPSGQEIDVGGLLCLFDAQGPCANAVKDSQRTKTWAGTTETLSIIWGHVDHADALEGAVRWYVELLAGYGAQAIDARLG